MRWNLIGYALLVIWKSAGNWFGEIDENIITNSNHPRRIFWPITDLWNEQETFHKRSNFLIATITEASSLCAYSGLIWMAIYHGLIEIKKNLMIIKGMNTKCMCVDDKRSA